MKIKLISFLILMFGFFALFAQQRALTPQKIEDFKTQTEYNMVLYKILLL